MTQTVHIPDSIEKAITALDGIGQLLKAKQWERAAIVYAFTRDGQGERNDLRTSDKSVRSYTLTDFASLGIVGLESRMTVRFYRRAWSEAIDRGEATEVQPGQIASLPTADWPGSPELKDNMYRQSQQRRNLEGETSTPQSRARVVRELLAEPAVADELEDDIVDLAADSPRITARVLTTSAERRPTPPQPTSPHRDMAAFGVGSGAIAHARRAYEDVATILESLTGSGAVSTTNRELVEKAITDLHAVGDIYHRYANLLAHAIREGSEPETTQAEATWIDQIERELSRMGRG